MGSRGKKILNLALNSNQPNEADTSKQTLQITDIPEHLEEQPVGQAFDDSDDSIVDKEYFPEPEELENISSESDGYQDDGQINNNSIEDVNQIAPDPEAIETNPSSERKTPKKRQPKLWKKNLRKIYKNSGNPYINSKGDYVPGKSIGKPCNASCRLKCNARLSEENRLSIFTSYWKLGNTDRQRDFINSLMEVGDCQRRIVTAENSRRSKTLKFHFNIENSRKRVCKTMFLNTLGIKKGVLNFAIKKRIPNTTTTERDRRGGYGTSKISEESLTFLKDHIKKFSTMASHYCRKDSKRHYLDSKLNLSIMYKLYQAECVENNTACLKESFYRYVFNTHFNLSFHTPKKDQCITCTAYAKSDPETKLTLQAAYDRHVHLKDRAREEKNSDKKDAQSNASTIHACNFDLQQVLYVPTDKTNPVLFYKTRLSTYNFTIFNTGNNTGKCFMWTEIEGGRGPSEIASCLFQHLKSLPLTTDSVRLFSDTCGGQNKNQFVAAMCIYAVQALPIQVIDQKFLISGHSQMECDSMHARIETAAKNIPVYLPHEWVTIAKNAKRHEPKYEVFEKRDINFIDWKPLAKHLMVNRNKDEDGTIINWHDIKWIRYEKANPFVMSVKTDFDDIFHKIVIVPRRGRRVTLATMEKSLKPLHEHKRPVSTVKLKNLTEISNAKNFPDDCKPFYRDLTADGNVENETVLPDINDEEDQNFF